MTKRLLVRAGVLAACVALVASCTSGDDSGDDGESGPAATSATAPSATGPSPGVADDSVKVGVTYVDTASLVASGLNYDLGDHRAVYDALFEAINADGGINGRTLEPVYAPIDPTSPEPAEAKCVQLTEDEDVFVVVGFFLADAVVCPVNTHATAVVGGEMTPERLGQAQAPWITWTPDTDQPVAVLDAMEERGELDGTIGVWAAERDQAEAEDVVIPHLEELGHDVAETAIAVAPATDQAAQQAEMSTIIERFRTADVDTVVLVGSSAQGWPQGINDTGSDYRPQLLFLTVVAPRAFSTNAATTDTTILEGMLAGGGYGPDQARFETASMQACVQTLTDAGLETPAPDDVGDDPSNQPYQAAFQACPDIDLLRAWLEAAGPDLNYGTLNAALDAGFEVTVSGDPDARTYGPPPAADGDPTVYFYGWDESAHDFVLDEG